MKPTPQDIAKAAIESAFEALEAEGLAKESGALARALQEETAKRQSIIRARIITPDGNAGDLPQMLTKFLQEKYGRDVEVTQDKDPAILGGAVIEFGDERIDVSLRGSLRDALRGLRSSTLSNS